MKPGQDEPGIEDSADQATRFPLLRTWRAVYVFVLVLFAGYVLLLVALERAFS